MQETTNIIQEKYGETARSGLSSNHSGIKAVAEAFGYTAEELASIPAEANMGLSCGNPLATAHIQEGETVVDLGSGGGLDVFLAAKQVGPTGRAIGIDMTPDMLELARKNARKDGYENVQFLEGKIDAIPLPDESADLVISNCVINLAPDKNKVFQEIFRILKPGGRVAVSDIALKQVLPQELAESAAALVGCIAGAILIQDYESGLRAAGFSDVAVIDSGADLTAYAAVEDTQACCSPGSCCSPASAKPMHVDLGEILRKYDVNAYAASVKVLAKK
ncbi:MAG TPA: arsenite methyltransferase [Phycisphaerales bacterium]|nr:arsenite methyltransferase [Phycisphaerales bacterium]